MNRIVLSTALTLAAATPFTMHGQDSSDPENLNRFSFGPSFGLNIKASFHNSSPGIPGSPGANPGPAVGGVDHTYDDGYVNVDSSGNAGGQTWNWGYHNGSQVVGDSLQFHSTQANPLTLPAHNNVTGDPQPGLELTYQRVLGHLPFGKSTHWGLEFGFGYTDLDVSDSRSAHGLNTLTTDTFPLNGVLPPGAGYNGTFNGPGTLLGDTPSRAITLDATTLASQQKLSGQLYTLRMGPFVEWNFTPKFSIAGSAGVALAPAVVDYDFSESYTTSSGTTTASGHTSRTELLYGFFASGKLTYDFTKHWGIYAGAEYESLSDMKLSIGTHTAFLDTGSMVNVSAGVVWSF